MNRTVLYENIKKILSNKNEIIFVYLYGSSLKVENPNDLDIGIYIDATIIKEEDEFDYSNRLSVELSYEFKKEIDVVILNYASLGLLKNVIQGKILLSKNDNIKDEFIERVISEYMDYYYYSKEYLKEVLNGWYRTY